MAPIIEGHQKLSIRCGGDDRDVHGVVLSEEDPSRSNLKHQEGPLHGQRHHSVVHAQGDRVDVAPDPAQGPHHTPPLQVPHLQSPVARARDSHRALLASSEGRHRVQVTCGGRRRRWGDSQSRVILANLAILTKSTLNVNLKGGIYEVFAYYLVFYRILVQQGVKLQYVP